MSAPDTPTLSDLQTRVHAALRHWHTPAAGPSPLAGLTLFASAQRQASGDAHQATQHLIRQALHFLETQHPQAASLLRRSFLDGELDERIALDLNIAASTLYRHKQSATHQLAHALWTLETQERSAKQARLLRRLGPTTGAPLVGIDDHIQRLEYLVVAAGPPWIIALSGMGGIGKTTLADALARRLVAQGSVQELGWVTAQQAPFEWEHLPAQPAPPALTTAALAEELLVQMTGDAALAHAPADEVLHRLQTRLADQPHLIVIDNLETVADSAALIATLRALAAPSKFLLTTRASLFAQPDIYPYAVPELAPPHALRLIRQEASRRNLPALQHATDAELMPILDVVGGNPLAIRLVVGQTYVHPLVTVLDNLTAARGARSESLYTFIYRQAWEQLDERARHTLLAMPLVPPAGADLDHLAQITALDASDLVEALETLVRLNLVDVRGDLHQRRYTIHSLTRTFLHQQVIRWQPDS